MKWLLSIELLYVLIIISVCIIILFNTRSHSKALAYILLVSFLPIAGIVIYFLFGFNYHRAKLFNKMSGENLALLKKLKVNLDTHYETLDKAATNLTPSQKILANYLFNSTKSPITAGNKIDLLVNGEKKFPAVQKAIEQAKKHIHLEYYIFEDDETGTSMVDLLVKKAKEGISIKFIYDDLGSRNVSGKLADKMKEVGIEVEPFYEIKYMAFANRINYRNHRKIIVIDGKQAFVGGINVANEYSNDEKLKNKLFWRDTHLYMEGPAVEYLQYIFLRDWNFCRQFKPEEHPDVFPNTEKDHQPGTHYVQIAASGPDTDLPHIEFSMLNAIYSAKESIQITTPYFIPSSSILDAMISAAKAGVTVELLVPANSDNKIVDYAARSFYSSLLTHGTHIYLYEKGFIHSKSMTIDDNLCIIGSANMDHRSFDLNFEVNAVIYSETFTAQMKKMFQEDLNDSSLINTEEWLQRGKIKQIPEKIFRLFSPLL